MTISRNILITRVKLWNFHTQSLHFLVKKMKNLPYRNSRMRLRFRNSYYDLRIPQYHDIHRQMTLGSRRALIIFLCSPKLGLFRFSHNSILISLTKTCKKRKISHYVMCFFVSDLQYLKNIPWNQFTLTWNQFTLTYDRPRTVRPTCPEIQFGHFH